MRVMGASSRRPLPGQGTLFELPAPRSTESPLERPPRPRARFIYQHTPEELAAFERSKAIAAQIRPDFLERGQRLCPGGCFKVIHGEARNCGRRWCDAVRPTWGRSMADVLHKALDAYCDLYGREAKVLSFAMTCTARPGWWDTARCSHSPGVQCSGTIGCRVRPEIERRERNLWPERKRAALNMARTEAIRKLRKIGYSLETGEKWPDLLMSVTEDQKRGLPHLHGVLGHTTKLEKVYAKAFLGALPRAARHHGLGFTDRYWWVVQQQSKYEAGRLRHYITKLTRYLAKDAHGAEFLQLHHGERIFYVAPWLTRLSGLTMTIARLCRRVWASRHGYCDPPKMTSEQEELVLRLLGPVVPPANSP
jgi:hypothetical protein